LTVSLTYRKIWNQKVA